MTQEEKAKKYDEVVCKLRRFMEQGIDPLITRADVQDFFPELKESEDEKIRKVLKHYLEVRRCQTQSDEEYINCNNFLAWLEKQGTSYTKKDVDDAYVEGMAFAKDELDKQGEQKPIDKIQLGKKYKCIASPRYSTFRRGNIYKPVDNFLCNLMNLCYECFEPIEDSEQKPTDDEMKEALQTEYEKGRADAFAQMQKEWSKEDESIALGIEQIVNCASLLNIAPDKLDKVRNWLKSLKDRVKSQNTWKPSDEQMEALFVLLPTVSYGKNPAFSLYNDLKKLKGE